MRDRLTALGSGDLDTYVRSEYLAGANLETLARSTGLGRRRLRDQIQSVGLETRHPGVDTAAGKRSRAVTPEVNAQSTFRQ